MQHLRLTNWRIVLAGVVVGVAIFAAVLTSLFWLLPSQSEADPSMNCGYVYSGAKSESVDFAISSAPEGAYVLFGSSELSTPKDVIPQVPEAIFGENNYGVNLVTVGEAYDQSLWQAIAAGAYGAADIPRKVIVIVSPTWFEDAGLDSETFKLRFSYPLYSAFCANSSISASTKEYVAQRLLEQGVSPTTVRAGMREGITGNIDNEVYLLADDLRMRAKLDEVRQHGIPVLSSEASVPDFEELSFQAQVDALVDSTNNAWGMDDAFYEGNIEGREEALRNSQSDERFSNNDEYQDFSVFLKVCRETNLEPLVVISPVHGPFYDHIGTSPEDREKCYERIRSICEENGVAVADFSNKEYEEFFLHDIVHFGWTGWIDVEEAIYNYVSE